MNQKLEQSNGRVDETAVVKHVTPGGRILYDADSILDSETARRHFDTLERMVKRGQIPRPAPAKP